MTETIRGKLARENNEKDAHLTKQIRGAGFNVDRDIASVFDPIIVTFEDNVVASITRLRRSYGHYQTHNGWKMKCPLWEPRNSYDRLGKMKEPNNPSHWGSRNLQKPSSVLDYLIEAKDAIPTPQKIREGKALARVSKARRSLRIAEEELKCAFSDADLIEYAIGRLPDTVPPEHQSRVRKARNRLQRYRNARELYEDQQAFYENVCCDGESE